MTIERFVVSLVLRQLRGPARTLARNTGGGCGIYHHHQLCQYSTTTTTQQGEEEINILHATFLNSTSTALTSIEEEEETQQPLRWLLRIPEHITIRH